MVLVGDMTRGNAFKQIILFALPITLGNILQQLFNMIDAYIVGQTLGNSALASVGVTGSITFLIIGFLNGMAEGACLLVARYFGANDKQMMNRCIGNIIYVSLFTVIPLTTLALFLNKPILLLMDTPADIIDGAVAYLTPIYGGMFATMLYDILAGILRAMGDSRSPLCFLMISAVINIGLDYLFIVPFNMGIAGAAYATVLSHLISAVCCLVYIFKKGILKLSREDIFPRTQLMLRICIMGLPMALQYSVTAVGSVITQAATNSLGSDTVTAVSVFSRLLNINWAVMGALSAAAANFTGQNIGAGNLTRVRKGLRVSIMITTFYSIGVTFLFFFLGTPLSAIFLDEKTDTIIALIDVLAKTQSVFLIFVGFVFIYRNCIQGMGFSTYAMSAGMLELIGRTAVSVIFVEAFGLYAISLASPAAWILADIFLIPMYIHIIRKLTKEHPEWVRVNE